MPFPAVLSASSCRVSRLFKMFFTGSFPAAHCAKYMMEVCMHKKSFIFIFLIAVLAASTVFAGGGNQAAAVSASNEVVFFRWHQNSAGLTYFNDALWVKELEKRTGVKLVMEGPLGGAAYLEAANVLLASGDVKDLFLYNWVNYNGGIEAAVSDGIALNYGKNQSYLNQLPNWMKLVNSSETIRRDLTLNSGGMAQFCTIAENRDLSAFAGIMIRQDWLDRLGLRVPTTIDEYYNVLTAFKLHDANGNGDPNDEIPYSDTGSNAFAQIISAWGLRHNMFYPDPQNPGKLTHWALYKNGQAFVDCLSTLSRWAREGLLDLDSFAQSNNQRIEKIVNNKVGSTWCNTSTYATWRDAINELNPGTNARLVAMPRLIGPEGKPYTIADSLIRFAQLHDSITINPKAERDGKMGNILKLLNYMYSDEGTELLGFGVEGVSFTRGPNGERNFMDIITKDPVLPVFEKAFQYALPVTGSFPKVQLYEAWLMGVPDPDQQAAHRVYVYGDDSILMPYVLLNSAQAEQNSAIMNDVNTAIVEFFAAIIRGTRQVSEIPAFQNQLRNMGILRALDINQAAYDQYLRR